MRSTEKGAIDAVLKARQGAMKIGDLLATADDYETEELRQLFAAARRQNKQLLHTLVETDAAQQAAIERGAGTLFEENRDEDDDGEDYPGGPTVEEALNHAADQSEANVRAFFGDSDALQEYDAYQQGAEAYYRGEKPSDNPYAEGEPEHEQWLDGLFHAGTFQEGYEVGQAGKPADNPYTEGESHHEQWARGHQAGTEARAAATPWDGLTLEIWTAPIQGYSAVEVLVGIGEEGVPVAAAQLTHAQTLFGRVWSLAALAETVEPAEAILTDLLAHLDEAAGVVVEGAEYPPELLTAMLTDAAGARDWQSTVKTWEPAERLEVAQYLWSLLRARQQLKADEDPVEIPPRPDLLAEVAIPLAVEVDNLAEARDARQARAALDAVGEEPETEEGEEIAPEDAEDLDADAETEEE